MKKIIDIILIISLLLVSFPVNAKTPETLGDLRKQYEDLLKEQQEYNNKSEAAKQEIKNKEAAITQAKKDLTDAEAKEEETELKIDESNKKIEELKLEVEKILLYLQHIESKNIYLEYVADASSITDFIMRVKGVKEISNYVQDTIDNLETEIEINEELVEELKQVQKELAEKIENYQNAIAKLYSNVEEYNEFALDLEDQVEAAKEEYEVNKRICQQNLGKTSDSVKLSDCSKVPVNGRWLKPLTSGVVTSPQGYRTHPVTGVAYSYHDGIDIGVSEGTPIYAAAAGQVVAKVSRSTCGGNRLYINVLVDGVQYTTYYYHLLRFNVNVGDVVDQNTIIGYVGGYSTSSRHGGYDTCTTGAHLHFGVQKGYYNVKTGLIRSNIMVPPGFRNNVGYRFTSRTDFYKG